MTKPHKIFSRKLVNEIVTFADFETLGIQGYMASREQVIDDALQLIKRFPEPPLGDPKDLEDLEKDTTILRNDSGT